MGGLLRMFSYQIVNRPVTEKRQVTVTKENLYTDEDGKLWLKYRRKKNELRASVRLLPEALALIEKYNDEERDTLFPMIHYPNLKNHLKTLAVLAGIKEINLCYHVGRHSFASLITLEAGVPIETISKMLGHSNIRTTQGYAKITEDKISKEMDKLIAKRSGGNEKRIS